MNSKNKLSKLQKKIKLIQTILSECYIDNVKYSQSLFVEIPMTYKENSFYPLILVADDKINKDIEIDIPIKNL